MHSLVDLMGSRPGKYRPGQGGAPTKLICFPARASTRLGFSKLGPIVRRTGSRLDVDEHFYN